MAATITCTRCKKQIPIDVFFDSCTNYFPDLRVMECTCPGCGDRIEAQPEPGAVWLGYIYAAGQPHFSGMEKVLVEGLRVSAGSQSMQITLGDRTWTLGKS